MFKIQSKFSLAKTHQKSTIKVRQIETENRNFFLGDTILVMKLDAPSSIFVYHDGGICFNLMSYALKQMLSTIDVEMPFLFGHA